MTTDSYEIASADYVVPINRAEMTRLREALTTARNTAESRATQRGPNWRAERERAVAYNDLLARLRQIETCDLGSGIAG